MPHRHWRAAWFIIDSVEYDGWFASDFSAAEVKELRAVQPRAPRSSKFDGAFEIPTFQEVIDLAKKESVRLGRTISIYPETKHPTWHRDNGLPLEETLVAMLNAAGYTSKASPVIIQSFEIGNLKRLREMTQVRIVQLLSAYDNNINTGKPIYLPGDPDSAPRDWIASGDTRNHGDMLTKAGRARLTRAWRSMRSLRARQAPALRQRSRSIVCGSRMPVSRTNDWWRRRPSPPPWWPKAGRRSVSAIVPLASFAACARFASSVQDPDAVVVTRANLLGKRTSVVATGEQNSLAIPQ